MHNTACVHEKCLKGEKRMQKRLANKNDNCVVPHISKIRRHRDIMNPRFQSRVEKLDVVLTNVKN